MQNRIRAALILGSIVASSAMAGVSPDQAAQLGKNLTPMGAEMAGNADGSIPAWNPAGSPVPAGYVPGSGNYIDPYAGEKPVYTINASNWKQHADNLTAGTKAMFEKYGADGWEMHVYPTHRDTTRPDWYNANTAKMPPAPPWWPMARKLRATTPACPSRFPNPAWKPCGTT